MQMIQSFKLFSVALVCAATPVLALTPADAPSGTYVLEKTHASFAWKVKHMDLALYSARFTKFDATITYDAAKPTNSAVSVTVDPNSIRTDYPFPEKEDFDKKLATDAKIFNSAAFPEIKFVSTKLVSAGQNTGKLSGNLTFLGVTKPVTLTVELTGATKSHRFTKAPALGFSASGKIKRSDFGMTVFTGAVADDVELEIHGEFIQAPAK